MSVCRVSFISMLVIDSRDQSRTTSTFFIVGSNLVQLYFLVDAIYIVSINDLFTLNRCGVSWQEDHVSLDCSECGGYAMQRPCPNCEGKCQSIWRRNLVAVSRFESV